MAVQMLSWLSEKVGIDITGEHSSTTSTSTSTSTSMTHGSEDVFDRLGRKVFGGGGSERETSDNWGYKFNPALGIWEPTSNAPVEIQHEQQERIAELASQDSTGANAAAPRKPVEPPPLLPLGVAPVVQSIHRDGRVPKYADHFNAYTTASLPPYGSGSQRAPSPLLPTTSSFPLPPPPPAAAAAAAEALLSGGPSFPTASSSFPAAAGAGAGAPPPLMPPQPTTAVLELPPPNLVS